MFEEMTKSLNIAGLAKKEQEEIIAELGNTIMQRIISSALRNLSEDESKKLDEIAGREDIQALTAFMYEKIPNFKEFAAKEAAAVLNEFNAEFNK